MSTALPTPSYDDVRREIEHFSPTMRLYRGDDVWFKFEFCGRDYWFPPDLGGKAAKHPLTGEMAVGDGILKVRDVHGRQQEKLSRKFTGAYGPLEGQEVSAILMFAITQFGDKGVVWLHGDDTDELRKKASKASVRNTKKAWAEHQRESRAAFVQNWQTFPQNKGRRVPPPTSEQRRAQKYLDLLAEEGAQGYEFVCEHGCSDFDSFDDYARHMKVNHGKVVKQAGEEAPEVAPPAPNLAGADAATENDPDAATKLQAAQAEAAELVKKTAPEKTGDRPGKKSGGK